LFEPSVDPPGFVDAIGWADHNRSRRGRAVTVPRIPRKSADRTVTLPVRAYSDLRGAEPVDGPR